MSVNVPFEKGNANRQRVASWWWLLALLLFTLGFDQASKSMATWKLRDRPACDLPGRVLTLQYARNPGGFLSLGGNLPARIRHVAFLLANSLLMVGLTVFMVLRRSSLPGLVMVWLTLILAGGIGNLIDRIMNQGLVTDFLILRCGPLQSGIFNLADVAILGGTLGMIGCLFLPIQPTEFAMPPVESECT